MKEDLRISCPDVCVVFNWVGSFSYTSPNVSSPPLLPALYTLLAVSACSCVKTTLGLCSCSGSSLPVLSVFRVHGDGGGVSVLCFM